MLARRSDRKINPDWNRQVRTYDANDLTPTYDHEPADDPWLSAHCRDLLPGDSLNLFFTPGPEDRPEGMSQHEWSSVMRVIAGEREIIAKVRYCDGCPVRAECLEIGMYEGHGVFGGTTPGERDSIRKGTYFIPRPRERGLTPKRDRVVAQVKEGYSLDDVADEMGITRRGAYEHLSLYLRSRHAE